jgi:hypothetical protein
MAIVAEAPGSSPPSDAMIVSAGRDLRNAAFRAEPGEPRAIADDPVSAEEIRRFNADLPALVDAWVAVHRPSSVERR